MKRLDYLKLLNVEFRDERNWKQFHTLKNLSVALSIEASELSELTLWKSNTEVERALEDESFCGDLKDECADILNYLILISEVGKFDLVQAGIDKVAKNGEKYPVEKSHSNATKYDKL